MESKNKRIISKFFLLISTLAISCVIFQNGTICLSNNDNNKFKEITNLKTSYYNNSCEPIFIDGKATGVGAHNWSWAVNQPWCTNKSGIYHIENLTINGNNNTSCIEIHNSNASFIIKNCTLYNSSFGTTPYIDAGIRIVNTSNGLIVNNNCSLNNGAGILLTNFSNNNVVLNNILNDNYAGIVVWGGNGECNNNDLYNNSLDYHAYAGIAVISSLYTNVSMNRAVNSSMGIIVQGCNYSLIYDNNVSLNILRGITISYSNFNTAINNIAFNNTYGIMVEYASFNNITGNILENNTYGIFLKSIDTSYTSSNNLLVNNTIIDSDELGLDISMYSENNTIYNNAFIGNTLHGEDNGTSNQWNITEMGNYWDNYTGLDSDFDGIGDIDYIYIGGSSGVIDELPLWSSYFEISGIEQDQVFGMPPPSFVISIGDLNYNSSWYSINGGNNITCTNLTSTGFIDFKSLIPFVPIGILYPINIYDETVNETEWENIWNGLNPGDNITIRFYFNNSEGHEIWKEISGVKDNINPNITILSPTISQAFDRNTPSFVIKIIEPFLDTIWYTLNNGLNNYTFSSNGTFNQAAWESMWDSLSHGDSITIIFYANDTAGNIGSAEVIVTIYNPPAQGFNLLDFLTSPLGLTIIIGSVGAIGIAIFFRKRSHKSTQKERDRIEGFMN